MSDQDLQSFMERLIATNRFAFGPGERRIGVPEHILKELEEIQAEESAKGRAHEWVDVVILAMDGLMRATREWMREAIRENEADEGEHKSVYTNRIAIRDGEPTNDAVAEAAMRLLVQKRDKNELRDWPDWRKNGDVALEHVKGTHD